MRIKATTTGLQVDEPMVSARIDNGKWTTKKPLSEVLERYGKFVDLDHLKTTGFQRIKVKDSVVEFKFV